LASYKKPRHIFFVDALPRTVEAGKVSKQALRRLARTKLTD
jgi:acyl-coenzyme A synthetase/AMP-(fatty) acid ligase